VVRDDRPVKVESMPMAEAIQKGADAFFDEKYGETVRTVRVKDYSFELCGGTHCHASGQIGSFVITGERSIGSGMRRIEALTGEAADALLDGRLQLLEQVTAAVGAQSPERVLERIEDLKTRSARPKGATSSGQARPAELVASAESLVGTRFLAYAHPFGSMEELKAYAKDVRGVLGDGVIALALEADEPQLFVTVSDDLVARGVSAGTLVATGAPVIDGKGGGRPQMAQARGSRRDRVPSALEAIRQALAETLANGVQATPAPTARGN
jgi:alanyl-tRNA synthetase